MYRDHAGGDAIGAAGEHCTARSFDHASVRLGEPDDEPATDGAWNE